MSTSSGDERFDFDGPSDSGRWEQGRGHSVRAQRLLVRVLLVLRGESRRTACPARDTQRAEILADRILADFPRRVLPIGLAAIAIVVLACSFPLVRDALPAAHLGSQPAPVASVLESGLRTRGEAMIDGIEALRAVVRPFAGSEGASSSAHGSNHDSVFDGNSEVGAVGPEAAAAPFTQS